MDYIKFSCFDLAEQKANLNDIHSKMTFFAENLSNVLSKFDLHEKGNVSIYSQLTDVKSAISDITDRIHNSANTLEQVVDRYYYADKNNIESIERLSNYMYLSKKPEDAITNPIMRTSSIISNDLILEGWLAELVYKKNAGV